MRSYMGCDGALYAFSLFIPTIIQQMGYKNTHAQLLSVPPYAVAAVVTITVGYIADRTGKRGNGIPSEVICNADRLEATATWLCLFLELLALLCCWVPETHTSNTLEHSWEPWASILAFQTQSRAFYWHSRVVNG
jgi:MFS family permease